VNFQGEQQVVSHPKAFPIVTPESPFLLPIVAVGRWLLLEYFDTGNLALVNPSTPMLFVSEDVCVINNYDDRPDHEPYHMRQMKALVKQTS